MTKLPIVSSIFVLGRVPQGSKKNLEESRWVGKNLRLDRSVPSKFRNAITTTTKKEKKIMIGFVKQSVRSSVNRITKLVVTCLKIGQMNHSGMVKCVIRVGFVDWYSVMRTPLPVNGFNWKGISTSLTRWHIQATQRCLSLKFCFHTNSETSSSDFPLLLLRSVFLLSIRAKFGSWRAFYFPIFTDFPYWAITARKYLNATWNFDSFIKFTLPYQIVAIEDIIQFW